MTLKNKNSVNEIRTKFIDYFTSVDYVEDHWYTLTEGEIKRKTF